MKSEKTRKPRSIGRIFTVTFIIMILIMAFAIGYGETNPHLTVLIFFDLQDYYHHVSAHSMRTSTHPNITLSQNPDSLNRPFLAR